MSNYTTANLVPVAPGTVTGKTLAVKIGEQIFLAGDNSGGGSTDFYRCASVSSTSTVVGYTVAGAGSTDCNGTYTDTGITWNNHHLYSMTSASTQQTYYLFFYSSAWVIATNYQDFTEFLDALYMTESDPPTSGWGASSGELDAPTVTAVMGTNTWTGYKAVLSNGVYSFESTVTSGLTYGSGFTPSVGEIYADGALLKAELYEGIPASDLVFYASLSASSGTAETGQTFTTEGTLSYSTVDGIPCAVFSQGKINIGSVFSQLQTGSSFTASLWVKNGTGSAFCLAPGTPGNAGTGLFVGLDTSDNSVSVYSEGTYRVTASNVSGLSGWTHVAVVGNSQSVTIYINGVSATSGNMWSIGPDSRTPYLGQYDAWYDDYFTGDLAAVRYYNRALSAAEIAALAGEFTPSVGS